MAAHMTYSSADRPVEIGAFASSHRVWRIVSVLSALVALGLVALASYLGQITSALWGVVGVCLALAAVMWGLTRVMQGSLRVEARGLVRASSVRETVEPWSEIGRALVGRTEVGQRQPSLIIEDREGRLSRAYGIGLINRPLEEAAALINEMLED